MSLKKTTTTITDHMDGQPSIVLANGNWGEFDPTQEKYVDTGLRATPEDDATAVKYYKLSKTAVALKAPSQMAGWHSREALDAKLEAEDWDEDPLTTNEEYRFCWIASYAKTNITDEVETVAQGRRVWKPHFTFTSVRLWSNYAPSPKITVDENGIISITDIHGNTISQAFVTPSTINGIAEKIEDLQKQVDDAVEAYAMEGAPTMSNKPVTDWLLDDNDIPITDNVLKASIFRAHLGDSYTDLNTFNSYRFVLISGGSEKDHTDYAWEVLAQSDYTEALAEIAKLGREKMTIHLDPASPNNPYRKGDMWITTVGGVTLTKVCIKNGTVYKEADWVQPYATQKDLDDTNAEINATKDGLAQANSDIQGLGVNLTELGEELDGMNDFFIGAIADGITKEELRAIQDLQGSIDIEQRQARSNMGYLVDNQYLSDDTKTILANIQTKFLKVTTGSVDKLQATINRIIADGKVDEAEREQYNSAYALYKTHMIEFNDAVALARKEIEERLEAITDEKVDEAVIKATYWSIKASTPVIYKDSNSATASGVHTPVVVNGELRSGTTTTQGGFISIQPNSGAETTATASPRTIAPTNTEGKTSYTVRLYEKADKATLLDTMTIPVVFKGSSGINIAMSNEADVLPASPTGEVSDYADTGNVIRVFEGANELAYTKPTTAIVKGEVVDISTKNVQNLVENGDFRNGQGSWSVYLGTIVSVENNVLTFLPDRGSAHLSPPSENIIKDSVFYINVGVKTLSDNVGIHRGYVKTVEYTGEGNWQTLSHRFDVSTGSRPLLGISQFSADSYSEISVRDYKIINLTQTFGAGNEPTKEECDVIFRGYFEGTVPLSDVSLGGNGTYQVYPSPTGITEGAKSVSGLACSFANASNMTTDSAKITFNINGLSSSGIPFEFSRTQNFTKSRAGQKGSDGKSITLVDVQYAVNTSPTTPPVETSNLWKTLAGTLTDSQQLWTRTKTTYSSGNPTYSTPANITPKIGAEGNSITSITEWYYLSTSKTELNGGSWSTTPWTWVHGMFMWTKTVFTYSKTDNTETLPIVSSEWEAVNELEIGGTNLLFQVQKNGEAIGFGYAYLEPNTKYILSGHKGLVENMTSKFDLQIRLTPGTAVNSDQIRDYGWSNSFPATFTTPSTIVRGTKYVVQLWNTGVGDAIGDRPFLKLEKGNKTTDWTPAPEDVQAEIDKSNAELAKIADDNLLTPSEKQDVKKEWEQIVDERSIIIAQAGTYGIPTTAYESKYSALSSYVTPLLSNMTVDSVIVGNTFRTRFKEYYTERVKLQKLITDGSKGYTDDNKSITIDISRQGSFKTYFKQVENDIVLEQPKKVSEVIGGVTVGGKKYVQCIATIYRGNEDVTDVALLRNANAIWFVNGVNVAQGGKVLNMSAEEFADGKDDDVQFQIDISNAKNWTND